MSRSTQFIGLTNDAIAWIKDLNSGDNLKVLEQKYNDKDLYFEKRSTQGMFDEEIPLRTWRRFYGKGNREVLIREVLQCSPWSSGPMLFTCLEIDFGNGKHSDSPGDEKFDGTSTAQCFQWVDDPSVENEADRVKGHMWA
jgi:hypothetical protein